jgi:hypothetical protein
VPPEPTSFVNSARGVRQFGFSGAFTRLLTSTTTTSPDSATTTLLRRRHGRSVEFTHRHCWVSVSIFSLYLLVLFLPVLQYACLDVL